MVQTVEDTRDIVRLPWINEGEIEHEMRFSVLDEAWKNFGYSGFLQGGPLADALARLGIEPLCPDQVGQYKKSKAKLAESGEYFWMQYSLGGYYRFPEKLVYQGFVPMFALDIANQIKREEPKALFFIDELTNQPFSRAPRMSHRWDSIRRAFASLRPLNVPDQDPFLSVALGRESFYVAVWDERDYRK